MSKITVAYWTQTGNTQEMANAIGSGIEEAGKVAEVVEVSRVSIEEIRTSEVLALGCPAMGDEVLEESEMEPFVRSIESIVQGKKVVLFGSYGWGDGQWMRDWEERMISAGAIIVGEKGLISQDAPDKDILEECKNLGKLLAEI